MSSQGSDRRAFLADSTRLFGALIAVPTLVGCTRSDEAVVKVTDDDETTQSRAELERADADLLLKAAELEESAVKVYNIAATLPFVRADVAVITTAGRFLAQHQQHRDALVKGAAELGLRGDPSRAPVPTIPKEIVDASKADDVRKRAVLAFARSLEMGAAKAYYAYVVRKLRTEHARRIAADILPVETQHVAVYDLLLAGTTPPAPTPFFSEQV